MPFDQQICTSLAPIRRAPRGDAPLDNEALYGERVEILRHEGEWVQARLERDDYMGFIPHGAVSEIENEPTHTVIVPRTYVFPTPDVKAAVTGALMMGARVCIAEKVGAFLRHVDGGYIFADHVAPLDYRAKDFVAVAEQFLNTPYLWGGRSYMGIDCSGLAQISLASIGVQAPRDSGPQEKALGLPLPLDLPPQEIQRGDLLFWPGHVAVSRGGGSMIHATAHSMQVVIEDIAKACARIAKSGPGLSSIRRLDF